MGGGKERNTQNAAPADTPYEAKGSRLIDPVIVRDGHHIDLQLGQSSVIAHEQARRGDGLLLSCGDIYYRYFCGTWTTFSKNQ